MTSAMRDKLRSAICVGPLSGLEDRVMAVACGEIERLEKIIAKELSENDELGAEYTFVNMLRGQVRSAREVIQFYADPNNWGDRVSGHGDSSRDVIRNDGGWGNCAGEKARRWHEENK